MGWIHQDDESDHEGFVVAVLPDGADAPRDTWEDTEKANAQDRNWAWSIKYDGADGRPRAAGVRAICLCGWRGPRQKADFATLETAEEALRRQWYHHAEVSMARTLPSRVQRLFDELEEAVLGLASPPREPAELDDTRPLAAVYAATLLRDHAERWQETAVRAAKADYSWEEIARALCTTKQSAHEKYRAAAEAFSSDTAAATGAAPREVR
ncbi:hypothetical protein ABZW18_21280 [Streptomyces sp. NPDC004647]|uniref:hypothetical protein n=1 Tax=Streptomyces sp. NPDC004647 TaxID=3154671 RepID=UPI0033A7A842